MFAASVSRSRLLTIVYSSLSLSLSFIEVVFSGAQSRGQKLLTHPWCHPVDSRRDNFPLDLQLRPILRVDDRALSLVVLSDAFGSLVNSPRYIAMGHWDRHSLCFVCSAEFIEARGGSGDLGPRTNNENGRPMSTLEVDDVVAKTPHLER